MRCALFLATLGACSRLPPSVPPPRIRADVVRPVPPKPFAVPDETMQFRVRFRGLTVGIVQTAIGHDGWIGEHPAIIVRSRGHGDGIAAMFGSLVWELTTTIDLEHAFPIDDHEEAWIEFAGKQDHEDDRHTWRPGDHHHDVHSAIGLLRGWHSKRDDRTQVEIRIGGGSFETEVWDAGHELLASAEKPAVRYDGVVERSVHFTIWLSDDSARVPLAFRCDTQFGMIAVDLVDYEVPPG